MQNRGKKKPQIAEVHKPIIPGSWHGRDAWRIAFKRFLATLLIALIYLFAGFLLAVDSLAGRIFTCIAVVLAVGYYQYASGMGQGQTDAAYGEILYTRRESGHNVPEAECERSYHPFKGFFAVLVGCAPFVLFALVFAFMTKPTLYRLGALPSWTEGLMAQTEFGDGLAYYRQQLGLSAMDVLRIVDRAMIMPFINVAAYFGSDGTLLAERLSPLLVLIAPMGYAIGYSQGMKLRVRINTGIQMGDDKKKRRERKARKKRQRSKAPEQLI